MPYKRCTANLLLFVSDLHTVNLDIVPCSNACHGTWAAFTVSSCMKMCLKPPSRNSDDCLCLVAFPVLRPRYKYSMGHSWRTDSSCSCFLSCMISATCLLMQLKRLGYAWTGVEYKPTKATPAPLSYVFSCSLVTCTSERHVIKLRRLMQTRWVCTDMGRANTTASCIL
jgi:hypothetical protein